MLRLKLTYDELFALVSCVQSKELKGRNAHELLLEDIRCELIIYLRSIALKGFKTSYTVKLSGSQCRALMSMFLHQLLPVDARMGFHVNKILGIIDKASKQPKMIPA